MPEVQTETSEREFPADLEGMRSLVKKCRARERQLKFEIESRQEENDGVIADNLKQNEELRALNVELQKFNLELEAKVQARTLELEASKHALEEHAQKLQELGVAKEALMHMIVHDMKNPLTVVLGTLGLFKNQTHNLESELHGMLINSFGQAQKLLSMIEEILFISRMQTKEFQLKPRQVDLKNLVGECTRTMEKTLGRKNLRFSVSLPPGPCLVMADPDMVERVVNNLLNNSIKYAPGESEICVTLNFANNVPTLGVANHGDPIPREYHEKIFELFTRVNAKDTQLSGTGLGLAFCKLAVEAHGGSLWVTSPLDTEDQGACFSFTLPSVSAA
ncbi:MAG: HAMP domain-containing histidine kinase [Candidatus Firestonebacteria bacterium]|nr:HAMP domain-containing histidine kinase [Candidatus Firestonebacteria bacterium]